MTEHPTSTAPHTTAPVSAGSVALLLLAAGASTRMGQPKQLLSYQGRTLLRHAAEIAVASGCTPLVLVTGAIHDALAAEVADLPIRVVRNPQWETGMASSIQVGLAAAAAAQPSAYLMMLSDQPLVTPQLLRQLVAHQQQTHAPVVAAAYGDTLGVPAIFDQTMVPALQKLQGAQGANRLIASLGAAVQRVSFPEGIWDVDTPEQYAALLAMLPTKSLPSTLPDPMTSPTDWLAIAQRLQALAQAGLFYAANEFDTERYQEVHNLSMQMMASLSHTPTDKLNALFANETGYPTPKVDVRAVVFRGTDELLMVQEKMDGNRWALPGGWGDVGYTPFEVAVKEVWEETGFETQAVRLLALLDKKRHAHPPQPWYVYKAFVLCRIVGGELQANTTETAEVRWVHSTELPTLDLSTDRVTLTQLEAMLEFAKQPDLPTLCD